MWEGLSHRMCRASLKVVLAWSITWKQSLELRAWQLSAGIYPRVSFIRYDVFTDTCRKILGSFTDIAGVTACTRKCIHDTWTKSFGVVYETEGVLKHLCCLLTPQMPSEPSAKNSFRFACDIKGLSMHNQFMASFDVESLVTGQLAWVCNFYFKFLNTGKWRVCCDFGF